MSSPWLAGLAGDIDARLRNELGRSGLQGLEVHSKTLPHYRFVDLYHAVEWYCAQHPPVMQIESEHVEEDLNTILHAKRPRWVSRRIKRSNHAPWPISADGDTYLPVDVFWACRARKLAVRLRYNAFSERAILEVAAAPATAESALTAILDRSIQSSIYRNQVLELVFESGTKDEFGDIEKQDRLRILFKAHEAVDDKDIVIDDEVREILQRNVIDLHQRRDILKEHHVPVRRGVLFYGPPGTGKTFACRYICGKLPHATRIIVTGTALLQVGSIFLLAKMLQPSLLVLEDVDLVFAAREINLYSSVLGDLLDHMDGLRPHEDITIVLTTNSIERMEAAIKDRPGRISQCVFFAPPKAELRERYLEHYLRRYDSQALEVKKLVDQSSGATQAFLKEWVHRAVQLATERISLGDHLDLRNEDFSAAFKEMKLYSEGSTGRILGFHG